MSKQHLRNVSVKEYITFLEKQGCKCNRSKGGHVHYTRQDIDRPITFQTHIEPVPEFIIRQHMRYLKLSKKEMLNLI